MYQKQLISLQKSLSLQGIDFEIEEVRGKDLALFPCKAIKTDIYPYGYPSGFEMDTHPNGFRFYGIKAIKERQQVYGIDNCMLIGDSGCDPIVMNKEGSIAWALHGVGQWDFYKISEDIIQYFQMLEIFVSLFFGLYNGNISDENFAIIPKKYNHILDEIDKLIHHRTMVDEFLKCILYL